MDEQEARACFLACVQAGAIVGAIRDGRAGAVAIDVVGMAWRVPAAAIPRQYDSDPQEAAVAYVSWHLDGGERPAWLPR